MLFSLPQMPIGMETYHFQASPVTFGQIFTLTHLLRYTASYAFLILTIM